MCVHASLCVHACILINSMICRMENASTRSLRLLLVTKDIRQLQRKMRMPSRKLLPMWDQSLWPLMQAIGASRLAVALTTYPTQNLTLFSFSSFSCTHCFCITVVQEGSVQ